MRREDSTEDRRGRRTARFSLAAVSNSILDAVKERVRSRSPMVERADDRSKSRGRINDKGKDKEVTKDHGKEKGKDKEKDGAWHFLEHKVGEVFHGEDHKEYGDGWREFKKGDRYISLVVISLTDGFSTPIRYLHLSYLVRHPRKYASHS